MEKNNGTVIVLVISGNSASDLRGIKIIKIS